jgi:hypothetical protein
MGPAAFIWPPDRPWSADVDNIAPCGSSAGVGNRTKYPVLSATLFTTSEHTDARTDTGFLQRMEDLHLC